MIPTIDPSTCSSDELIEVCKKFGMFYCPVKDVNVASVLGQMDEYFAQPDEIKIKEFIPNTLAFVLQSYREGGIPKRGYNKAETKETYSYFSPRVVGDEHEEFHKTLDDYSEELYKVSEEILNKLAVRTRFGTNPLNTSLSLINYLDDTDDTPRILLGAHRDWGLLTFLFTTAPGLCVEFDEEWIEIPPLEGHFIVNLGNVMNLMFGFKAPLHRVEKMKEKTNKRSIAFFVEPKPECVIQNHKRRIVDTYMHFIEQLCRVRGHIKS